jgi:hypothetical protein
VFITSDQLNANYLGGEIKLFKRREVNKLGTSFFHGVRIGAGHLSRKSNTIQGGDFAFDTLQSIYSKHIFVESIKKAKNIKDYKLNVNIDLFNFNIKYTLLIEQKLSEKFSVFGGFDIPLIRLFFYNDVKFQTGVELNTESFFTGFKSYSLNTKSSESFNKNFAYSLKKNQATSLKLGVKYLF